MRKVSIALLVLLGMSMSAWLYGANKFEQIAINEILPKIKDSANIITADTDATIIEKYKFKIILKNVTILPKSPLGEIYVDGIVVTCNPISNDITVSLTNDKLENTGGSPATYIIAKDIKAEFSKSLLDIETTRSGRINVTSGPISTHLSKDDSLISRSKKSSTNLLVKLDAEGFYRAEIKSDDEAKEFLFNQEFFKSSAEMVPSASMETLNTAFGKESMYDFNTKIGKFAEYFVNIQNKTGPVNVLSKGYVKLEKKHVDNIFAALKGEIVPTELLKNFNLTEDNFSLSIEENYSNSYIADSLKIELAGDNGKVKSDIDLILSRNYTDVQKASVADETSKLLLEYLNTNDRFESVVHQDDIKALVNKYSDIKETKLSLNLEFDVPSKTVDHNVSIKLDNFALNSKGLLDGAKYNGDVKIATPKLLIDSLFELYNASIKQVVNKLTNKDIVDINNLNLVVENFKNNGMEFLAAFDKKSSLKEEDALEVNINCNLEKFEFKINDKGFLTFLVDERVTKFLKDMPSAK